MSNSADKSTSNGPLLDEDSDVIELVDEVASSQQAQDLFGDDAFDLAMPEFKLPGLDAASAQETTRDEDAETESTQRLDAAALQFDENQNLATQRLDTLDIPTEAPVDRPQSKPKSFSTMQIDLSDMQTLEEMSFEEMDFEEINTVQAEIPASAPPVQTPPVQAPPLSDPNFGAEPLPVKQKPKQDTLLQYAERPASTPQNEPEPQDTAATLDLVETETETLGPDQDTDHDPKEVYDREEMMRTIQMQAIDRDAIERQIARERLEGAQPIEAHLFAPDLLVTPPRTLTKRWQEWQGIPGPEAPTQQAPAPTTGPPPSLRGQQPPKSRPPQRSRQQTGPARPVSGKHPAAQRPPGRGKGPTPVAGKPAVQRPAMADTPIDPSTAVPPQQSRGGSAPQSIVQQKPKAVAQPNKATAPKPSSGDDELDGLVKELLDESAKKEKPKAVQTSKPGRENWFKEVFTEEYFRTIPPTFARQTERELDFIDRSLSLQAGARILDLACGYGRHSVSLASRQFEVVGLDLSMDMLQRALALAQSRSLSIKFIHGDMRSLNFNGIFDGCLLWQSSFGYFDDITNFKVLQGIWRALKPGARFLIDIINRDHVAVQMPSRCWWEGQDCIFLEEVDFDSSQSILHTKRSFIYEDGSAPLEHNMYLRLYSLHEISNLIANAGFRIMEISGEIHHRGRFLGPSNPRIVILAEKKMPNA